MEEKPKIAVLGNGTVAVECCKHMVERGDRIAFIVGDAKDDGKDGWQKSLKKFAEERGIEFHRPATINEEKWYEFFRKEAPDYLLSFQYRFIIKRQIIESAKRLAANLHFAPLPKYRGMYPVAWALLNGEREFGVTIHEIDPGVDSGDMIAQTLFPIEETDDAKKLYMKAVENGVELFRESWPSMLSMKFERKRQNPEEVLYYPAGSIDFSKNRIDWSKPAEEVFNFIRALIFVPFQLPTTSYDGKEVMVVRVRRAGRAEGAKLGEVLGISKEGARVACTDGSLTIAITDRLSEEIPAQLEFMKKRGMIVGRSFR